jgi:hypothetical protein
MEVEILQMAQEEVKKRPSFYGVSSKKASNGGSGTP